MNIFCWVLITLPPQLFYANSSYLEGTVKKFVNVYFTSASIIASIFLPRRCCIAFLSRKFDSTTQHTAQRRGGGEKSQLCIALSKEGNLKFFFILPRSVVTDKRHHQHQNFRRCSKKRPKDLDAISRDWLIATSRPYWTICTTNWCAAVCKTTSYFHSLSACKSM